MKKVNLLLAFAGAVPLFFHTDTVFSQGRGPESGCKVCAISTDDWTVGKIHGKQGGKDVYVEPKYANQGGDVGQLAGGGCTYRDCRWTGQIQAIVTGDFTGTVRVEIWLDNLLKKDGSVRSGGTVAWTVTGSGNDKIESACSNNAPTAKKVKVVLIADQGGSSEKTFTCNKAVVPVLGPQKKKKE